MTQARVRHGLETNLKAWADAQTPAIPITWQNVPFTPPLGRYIRAFLLPAETKELFTDGSGRDYLGVFQASLVMGFGVGAGGAEDLLASLDAYFTVPFITSSGLRIWLSPLYASPAIQEADRWVLPMTTRYQAVEA